MNMFKVKVMNDMIDKLYTEFSTDTLEQKQRLTKLERLFQARRRSIRMDCISGKI